MSTAVTVDAVVHQDGIQIVDEDLYRTRVKRAVKAWGSGTALKVRIEPEEEAVQYYQFKHLFGHVFEPVCDFTGYTKQELCLMAKAEGFMPEGKTSLTELSREEMDEFTKQAEKWLHEECPDAFALYEPRGDVSHVA